MGLLTDPSEGQGKLTKLLPQKYPRICVLLYLGGIAYFCSLAYPPMNQSTYFSENALLPGLVKSQFLEDNYAELYHEELLDEMKKYDSSIPSSWLLAKFRQIGLDAYTHNFTLNYPLGDSKTFTGKNVYGILRAARASSTEALVISAPYRPPLSVHQSTSASIALMLAFAMFANKKLYWAKDIIFLVTEHEQLGIQAWLEAYHGTGCGGEGVLDRGVLKGRAGAIQAAVNLELHDIVIGQIDIKIEGLNGQLPNLDLFNLAAKICLKENVYHTFKQRHPRNFRDPLKDWLYSFQTLLAMVGTQATGIPNGNHGLFHRFGIEALTIEGFSTSNIRGPRQVGLLVIGRIIEGIFRSLNNLLERLHQSFFFYLLPSSDRFISIGLYMPSVCVIAGTLFIKSLAIRCRLKQEKDHKKENDEDDEVDADDDKGDDDKKKQKSKAIKGDTDGNGVYATTYMCNWTEMKTKFNKEMNRKDLHVDPDSVDVASVLFVLFLAHLFGVLIMHCPQILTMIGRQYNYTNEVSLYFGLGIISLLLVLTPIFIPFRHHSNTMSVFHILTLLEMGTALICVSMNNFSLALFISVLYVPFAMLISSNTSNRLLSFVQKLFWLLLHPFIVLTVTVLCYTFVMFPGETNYDNFHRAIQATQQALVFSIVDSMIYGNWMFGVVTSVFLPNWLCLWFVAFSHLQKQKQSPKTGKEKIN